MARLKYKVIGICGEAGSGKDTFARALVQAFNKQGLAARPVVSYTTRPKRDYEVADLDYHYIEPDTLRALILENKILECAEFNNWFYATGIDDLKSNMLNIAVLNPEGLESLSIDNRIDLAVIRCYCNDKERLIRQLNREENPNIDEIIRRYKADKQDFNDLRAETLVNNKQYYAILTDCGATPDQQASTIVEYMRLWAKIDI